MSSSELVTTVIAALLGGGGVVFIGAVVNGVRSIREGARTHTRETIADLAHHRDEADESRRVAARDRDFWRGVAADYAWQLRTAGIPPIPADPVPPSDR